MKKVLSISVKGKFIQYLKMSEVHFIANMVEDMGEITVNQVVLSIEAYKQYFTL